MHPWIIAYVGLDGRRHRERTTATTKAEAEAVLREKLSGITKATITGVHSLESLKPRLYTDFVKDEYLPHCQSVHTASTFLGDKRNAAITCRAFGKMPMRSISKGDVQRYVDQRAQAITRFATKIRPATVNRELNFIKGVLTEAVNRGYLEKNPAGGLSTLHEDNKRTRWLSDKEEQALHLHSPMFLRPIIQVALHTGMRLGEVLGLRWTDVDFEKMSIQLSRTKSHRVRNIPINADLESVLNSLDRFTGPDGASPYVFTNSKTGSRYRNITASFRGACDKAGLEGVTFHTLRHTFASRLVQRGVSLRVVQELLGHSTINVTERYAHLAPGAQREAVALLAGARSDLNVGTSTAQNRTPKSRAL